MILNTFHEYRLKEMLEKSNKRYAYIDIARGIGIILVVWGHTGGPMINYINQFHMPLFFTLYIPFIVFNGILFMLTVFLQPDWLK